MKRKYNIDETRIYLTGISDGGTGVYYVALKEPNSWSSYLPLNGSLAVLRDPDNGADGELHGNNLINAPLYVVNGEITRNHRPRHSNCNFNRPWADHPASIALLTPDVRRIW